jgi:predicted dehydrogenase
MIDRNRRGLVLAAGGALAAGAVGNMAWAAPPDRKLGYAIVGLGSYGLGIIIPQFKNCKNSRLVALVSGDAAKAKRVAQEYGVPEKNLYNYQNYDDIRNNPDIDIVYICLPVAMHAEYTIRAAKAGKHVLCEKPMAVSSAECEAMIAACRQAGKKLMIGYRCHFEPYNLEARRIARAGEIGKLRYFRSEHGFNFRDPNAWRLKKALAGGGSMMDIGIYALNAARYLTNEEPVAVNAMMHSTPDDPRFVEVEENITFQLRFPSGILANCTSSYGAGLNRFRVAKPRGSAELEPALSYNGLRFRVFRGSTIEERALPQRDHFALEMDHLAGCVLTGAEPLTPGEEGLKDLRVMMAIYDAARTGRTVSMS